MRFAQQIPHARMFKFAAHCGLDGGAAAQPRHAFALRRIDIHAHQLLHAGGKALRQIGFGRRHLHVERKRLIEDTHHLAVGVMTQPLAQFGFHAFQHRGVGVGIEAAHAPPVAREAQLHCGLAGPCSSALLAQKHADMHELIAHGSGT